MAAVEPSANPMRFNEAISGRFGDVEPQRHWMGAAAGLAGVWAHDNTRESIWDAMNRKEVYATTGTRMQVRVFAGWDFSEADLPRHDFASYGYAHGAPMGGDLASAPKGKKPQLLIRAMRDPDGANLDRLQVIKGWTNADGSTAEAVYDVAWSGDRVPDANGKLAAVGETVDAKQATYTNSIGEPYLSAFWTDPAFDPQQRAFYYVRVLEIPTPRWTTFDRKLFGVELPDGAPLSIQERAYTSPVWYTP